MNVEVKVPTPESNLGGNDNESKKGFSKTTNNRRGQNRSKQHRNGGRRSGKNSANKQGNSKGTYHGSRFGNTANLMLTPELGRLAAAINMGIPAGVPCNFADGVNLIDYSDNFEREPGIAVNIVNMVPGGTSNSTGDPINEAARSMQVTIRNKLNANRTQYGKIDLFKVPYAVDSLLAWLEHLKRVYAVASGKSSPMNKYYPDQLLLALNVNPADRVNLRIELKLYIEMLQNRLETFVVPKLPLFEEDQIAFKYIYKDEDIDKAQIIVDIPGYVWKFTRYTDSSGVVRSKLVPKAYFRGFSNPYTCAELKNFTEDLLSEIINDDAIAIICADIRTGYEGNVYKYSSKVDEDYKFICGDSAKEYLTKWHNSVQSGISATYPGMANYEITEATTLNYDPYLVFDPEVTFANAGTFEVFKRGCGNRFVDFYDKAVTPDMVFEACKWMCTLKVSDAATYKMKFRNLGFQYVSATYFGHFNAQRQFEFIAFDGGILWYKKTSSTYPTTEFALREADFKVFNIIAKWNYHPLAVQIMANDEITPGDHGYISVFGDLGNYTVIDSRILDNIFNVMNYTALGVNPLLRSR